MRDRPLSLAEARLGEAGLTCPVKFIKIFLGKAARSSNGRTSPSEGEYLGSSPSPAALAGSVSRMDIQITKRVPEDARGQA